MQGMDDRALLKASKQISCALACAGKHSGPCTTSISLRTQTFWGNLISNLSHSWGSTSPFVQANVVCLELMLTSYENDYDVDDFTQIKRRMMQRLPNLIAASLWFEASSYCVSPFRRFTPPSKLKHLDLGLGNLGTLAYMDFAALFPLLETARISACMESGT